jgi:hypothetical protein
MAKGKKQNLFPKSGKCDIVEGILMGNKQTNALNKKYQEDQKPDYMIRKLLAVAQQSSDPELKGQASKAAELLKDLPGNVPAPSIDRARILREACNCINVAVLATA